MSEAPRTLRADLERLRAGAAAARRDAVPRLEAAVRAHPGVAVAAALGAGFVLGGGLDRRTGMLLLGAGARFVGSWLSGRIAPET